MVYFDMPTVSGLIFFYIVFPFYNAGKYRKINVLMVISPKNWEFLLFFMSTLWIIQPHLQSFNDFI